MSAEFIGYVGTSYSSETHPPKSKGIDREHVRAAAQAHDRFGFDRVLVAFHSTSPDSTQVANFIAAVTERVNVMIAHRPGFAAPTVAARTFATFDQFSQGRVGIHIITGGSDPEQRQDGDFLNKAERYARSDEYVGLLKRMWTEDKPFSHEGRFYKVENAFSEVKPWQAELPVYFGGSSDEAIDVAGRRADIYALWGETREQVRETIARVRASAARYNREIRFSLSFRPILADTEEKAWARAEAIVARTKEVRAAAGLGDPTPPANVGSQRLLDAAAKGLRPEGRLFTGVAAATGARGNSTALVGTPDQVAHALLDYYDLGVTTFLIRGFDVIEDAIQYGQELIPATKRLIAEREATATAAE